MSFTVLVPARLASTRLPRKPLADIAGLPMIVRVARRAAQSSAKSVVVAADHPDIVAACEMHGVRVVPTRSDHATGSDRLAEACALLGLDGDDAVVNVESSHCYGSIAAFLSEASRVLRPGGVFLFADLRKADDMAALERALDAQPGWRRIAREDITAAVVAALEADDARRRQLIEELVRRPRARKPAGEFAGVVGSRIYDNFRTREFLYHRYAYRKL